MRSNVFFVRSGAAWVLIDTGSAHCADAIQAASETLFGPVARPAAILLTHGHPDHAGSTRELVRRWGCSVYVHPDELRFVTTDVATFFAIYREYTTSAGRWGPPPLDRWIILPMMRAMPWRRRESMLAESDFKEAARAFDPESGLPGLPGWACVPTPGHTPGHAAFFRLTDRVVIAGDAVLTADVNSVTGFVRWSRGRSTQSLGGPPWYTTWSRRVASQSAAALARLDPAVLATGHGTPLSGAGTSDALRAYVNRLRRTSR